MATDLRDYKASDRCRQRHWRARKSQESSMLELWTVYDRPPGEVFVGADPLLQETVA